MEAASCMQTVRKYKSYYVASISRQSWIKKDPNAMQEKVASFRKRSTGSDVKSSKMVAASMTKIVPAAKITFTLALAISQFIFFGVPALEKYSSAVVGEAKMFKRGTV